jgi:hypothetical protein
VKAKWSLQRIRKDLGDWIAHPGKRQSMQERPSWEIRDYTGGDPVVITSNLRTLSTWYLNNGSFSVLNGDQDGWQDLTTAEKCLSWHIQLVSRLFRGKKIATATPALVANDVALSLALSISLGFLGDAEALGKILVTGLADCLLSKNRHSHLLPFMVRLFCDWSAFPLPDTNEMASLGGYESLMMTWRSKELDPIANAISKAADFHILRSRDSSNRESFEFDRTAFRAFPVEILAVSRLRAAMHLPEPSVEHPLLDSPLGQLVPVLGYEPDPIVNLAVEKMTLDLHDAEI